MDVLLTDHRAIKPYLGVRENKLDYSPTHNKAIESVEERHEVALRAKRVDLQQHFQREETQKNSVQKT